MSIPLTGRVERLPVRDVWPHEALAFTPWLSQNLDVIGELVGLELSLESIEQTLENFRVDIIASDARGRSVVIENQFGDSDHKHLGQLLSYYASWNADVAIWIVEKARAEHVKAVSVMNEHFPADFYLVQVEAIRIGDSLPALLPTLIYGPSPETKQAARASRELEERKADYRSFWELLSQRAREGHGPADAAGRLWYQRLVGGSGNLPGSQYLKYSSGISGHWFVFHLMGEFRRIELNLFYRNQPELATQAFQGLLANKAEIEQQFGRSLTWDPREDSMSASIRCDYPGGGWQSDESEWPAACDELLREMDRFEQVMIRHIGE
ncbi:DUF4268 domain-containing protein [bacterium]|nr:DUF4268 domain-containing protein [bacterium]